MMWQSLSNYFLILVLVFHPLLVADSLAININPHDITLDVRLPQCKTCHLEGNQLGGDGKRHLAAMTVDGISSCTGCHESAAAKHMVGQRPSFKVPGYLPLDEQGRITCLTCHYSHGRLQGDKPWIDVSWIDRLTNSESLHKTYLLRRHNRNGHLCMACHDPRVTQE